MSTSQESSNNAEPDSEAQPINLAHRPATVAGRNTTEQSKSIYLVKPNTNLAPVHGVVVTSVVGVPLTTTPPPAHTSSSTVMAIPVPMSMTRIQTAVRPGTPIALAPRAVPASSSISYSGISVPVTQVTTLHVPKGPAAVASLSVPRAVLSQTAAPTRPGTPSPVPVTTTTTAVGLVKPPRPTIATVRPSGLIVGTTGSLAGTWLPVSAGSLNTGGGQTITAISSAAVRAPLAIPKSSGAGKAIPLPTPVSAGIARVPPPRSAIMTVNARAAIPGSISGPRGVGDLIRTAQPSAVRPLATTQPPTLIQVGEKQIKSGSVTITSTSNSPATAGNRSVSGSGGLVQQVARPAPSPSTAAQNVPTIATIPGRIAVSSVVNASAGGTVTGTPLLFSGSLKTTMASNTKGPLAQISVSSVGSKPFSIGTTITTRPVTVVTTSNTGAISNRPLIIAGASNPTTVLPVAKVLPQPVLPSPSGPVKAVDLSTNSSAAVSGSNTQSQQIEVHSSALTVLPGPPQPITVATSVPAGIYLQKAPTGPPVEKGTPAGPYSFPTAAIYYESAERTTFHSFISNSGPLIQQPPSLANRNSAAASELPLPSSSQSLSSIQTVTSKVGSSPRPSILRKRDHDGAPLKAQKNLSAALALVTSSASSSVPTPAQPSAISPPGESTMHGESSRSSTGSTTLSASSSPGIPADMDDSNPPPPPPPIITSTASLIGKAFSSIQVKQELLETSLSRLASASVTQGPPVEMSPRKKPRKQQLLGQELQEVRSSDEELKQQLLLLKPEVKREAPAPPKGPAESSLTVLKRPRTSLISGYKQTWKSRNNHFVRYSDVKLKDERRPTVTDLANQKQVMQKVNGWKVYHLSAQIEEMARLENEAHDRLTVLLDLMETLGAAEGTDRDLTRVHELIKGNLQRSKVIQDQLQESKTQVLKVFEHKPRVEEIIHRYMFKRLPKKREKS